MLDRVVSVDGQWRELQVILDDRRAKLNKASRSFGILRGSVSRGELTRDDFLGSPGIDDLLQGSDIANVALDELMDKLQGMLRSKSEEVAAYASRTSAADGQINELLSYLPNLPEDSVPDGGSEEDNVVTRQWGEIPSYEFRAAGALGPRACAGHYRL